MGLFGGDSSSSTTNNNIDESQKLSGGNDSVVSATNIKANEGSIVNVTDNGAVKSAMAFAAHVSASGESMYQGALATVRDQNKLLAQAYQNGQAGDQTQLKYAGFAVVGLAVAAAAAIAMKAK